jgi:N-acylneuraminate cytidylyltransferase
MKILAIIPARSGSKSIKNKNIINYKGKPLIYHTIKVALKSKYIDKVIISTDSKKYKKIAEKFGAEVPFLRPKKISQDLSVDYDYILHATKFLIKKNYNPDLVILLRPTTPNRKVKILDECISHFIKNIRKYDSLRSISEFNQPVQKLFMIKNNQLKGFFDKTLRGEYHACPRQKFPKTFLPNGYIDIIKPNFFLKKKILYGTMCPFLTEETLDIDYKEDLEK